MTSVLTAKVVPINWVPNHHYDLDMRIDGLEQVAQGHIWFCKVFVVRDIFPGKRIKVVGTAINCVNKKIKHSYNK